MTQAYLLEKLRWAVHVLALLPAAILPGEWLSGALSANPIQEAIQRSGRVAIALLVATLAVRPLSQWLRWKRLLAYRRTLGLYAFAYALLHTCLFLFVDYQLALHLVYRELTEKPYLWFGVGTFAILLPLAVTSFRYWMRKLGKSWKRLHQLIYLASVLAVLHYGSAVKGDFLALRGEVLRPWIYGLGVALLLGWRARQSVLKRLRLCRLSCCVATKSLDQEIRSPQPKG